MFLRVEGVVQKAAKVMEKYMTRIARDGKDIIDEEGYRNNGDLINSINLKPSAIAYANKIACEISASTDYAQYIHEGTKRHFVPFSVAPSLLVWAERNKVIYRKTKQGKEARKNSNILSKNVEGIRADRYYFYSKKDKKEYPIDIHRGGLRVEIRPTKFFEKPFNSVKEDFLNEMNRIVSEL